MAALPAARRNAQNLRRWQAFGLALSIELAVLLCALTWLTTTSTPVEQAVVPLSIELLKPDTSPDPEIRPQAAPAKPVPHVPSLPVALPAQRVVQRSVELAPASPQTLAAAAPPEVVPAAAATLQPNPYSSPVQVSQAVSAAPPSLPVVDPAPAYNARLAAAVQAAFELPAAASALNFKGRTRIEFALHDGLASAIRVIVTSGLGAVDRAAVKAVQAAVFPSPPAALQGKEGGYQIWVACF